MSISYNKKGPVYDLGLCRCCGATKKCRVLNVEYEYIEKKEIYSDMFFECFGLLLCNLDGEPTERLICAMCVARLREANSFRLQVLQCEEEMLKAQIHLHGYGCCPTPMKIDNDDEIKQEKYSDDCENCDRHNNESELLKEISKASERKGKMTSKEHLQAKKQLLHKMRKTRERVLRMKRIGKQKPQCIDAAPKYIDDESLAYHNTVALIENSYICPFQTSYSNYFCMYCKRTFADPVRLREHNMTHDPKNFKYFFNCNKATYIDIDRIDCRHCDSKINDVEDFKAHAREAHNVTFNDVKDELLKFKLSVNSFVCTECGKDYVFFHALKRHMAVHFGEFVCESCGSHYFDKRTLEVHIRNSHAKQTGYTCDDCGKVFKSKHSMCVHMSCVHKKEAAFQCSKCDATLFSAKERASHMWSAHGVSRSCSCSWCGRAFCARKALLEHVRGRRCRRCKDQKELPV